MENKRFSCVHCGVKNCHNHKSQYPDFCLTTGAETQAPLEESWRIYNENEEVRNIAVASAQVEAEHYCQAPRVEEIMYFAKKIGAKKIGIATCVGLINESRTFAKILEAQGFEPYGVVCKVGSHPKEDLGITDDEKVRPGTFEPYCNPVAQALILNEAKTDLNVIVGLCVGHDSLFIKYSDAIVTTLVTKDRVLAHNPCGALYTSSSYYSRLMDKPLFADEPTSADEPKDKE